MNENLNDEYLDSMNFLNEISINYPQAISFASGRPKEELFEVETIVDGIKDYVKNNKSDTSSYKDFFNYLGQYNKTKGIINEEICQLVKNDEDIVVSSEEIILTDGAQEAMAIIINTIFSKKDEVLLVRDPSYVGLIGYAKIAGIPIEWIKSDKGQVDIEGLEETIKRIIKTGKRPRALYEVPDFHNPMGNYMSLDDRKSLIGLAEKYGFYIIEDNPYGYFRYEVDKIPTLKALDQNNHVLYIGSFAKSIFPSIRIGYLIVNKEMVEDCKKVKSFMTVNTSTLLQAMVGGLIRRENYSLEEFCQAKVQACKKSRDLLLKELEKNIDTGWRWQVPCGGFFLVLELPFKMTDELLLECVEKYGVIVCPMYMFSLDSKKETRQVRLAFSNINPEQINDGITRLANFVRSKL